MQTACALLLALTWPVAAASYHVAGAAANASDGNCGLEGQPWKTIGRAANEPPKHTKVLNNLLPGNYISSGTVTRGSDLTLEMNPDPAWRADMGSESDFNVYANNAWTPTMRHNWNDNNLLAQWQERYAQDRHSRQLNVDDELFATGFRLCSAAGLDVAGPLPEAVARIWQPNDARRVGADPVTWPVAP